MRDVLCHDYIGSDRIRIGEYLHIERIVGERQLLGRQRSGCDPQRNRQSPGLDPKRLTM